jgi:hypothetical protein
VALPGLLLAGLHQAARLLGCGGGHMHTGTPPPPCSKVRYDEVAAVADGRRLRRGDVAGVMRRLKGDFANAYFVTGIIDGSIYAPDCFFADPTIAFSGLDLWRRNLQLLTPSLVRNPGCWATELLDRWAAGQAALALGGPLRLPRSLAAAQTRWVAGRHVCCVPPLTSTLRPLVRCCATDRAVGEADEFAETWQEQRGAGGAHGAAACLGAAGTCVGAWACEHTPVGLAGQVLRSMQRSALVAGSCCLLAPAAKASNEAGWRCLQPACGALQAEWALRTYLSLPWKPLIAILGSTEYVLNDDANQVGGWGGRRGASLACSAMPSQAGLTFLTSTPLLPPPHLPANAHR